MQTTANHYMYQRNGIYYYSRRVPLDLQDQHPIKRIVVSLHTRSEKSALAGSFRLTHELDGYWSSIRVSRLTKTLIPSPKQSFTNKTNITLEQARDLYLKLKGHNKPKLFHQVANRNTGYVIDVLGNKDLSDLTSIDAGKFRDSLLSRGLASSSVRRVFSSIKSIVNLSIKETGLDISNPFLGTYIPDLEDTLERQPIPPKTINKIQLSCESINDELRWMVALISDTGMRLGEAAGLKASDVIIDCAHPYLIIQPNSCRRLKTKQSERKIPLVGYSLWAAKKAIQACESEYLFQRYNKTGVCNANSASAALNKWLKLHVEKDVVIHSFRHSIRDRLRNVECPSDIVDSIGGWSKRSIGESYGSGYQLPILHKWMNKITDPG